VKKPFRAQDEASEELDHAARWYDERRSGLGHRFLASVDATLHQIERFPGSGAPVPEVPQGLAVRQAPINGFPYHVVYLETADTTTRSAAFPAAMKTSAVSPSNRQSNVAFEHRCLQPRALSALPQCSSV
jgi:hypothetical protein